MQELYAPRSSPLHSLDARVKVLITLAFILSLNLTPLNAWPAYILYLAITLSAALISHLGFAFVLKRALLALPFVLAALPLVFTGLGPRLPVHILPGVEWMYSPAGLERFIAIAIRSWISMQAAILLAAATHFSDLLTALRQLKLPKIFVTILALMWRYLWVITDEARRMMQARASRSAALNRRPGGTLQWRARVTGGMAGSLFLRSLERSDRVYAAMLARGFTGEPPAARVAPLAQRERWILAAAAILLALLWVFAVMSAG